MIGQDDYVSFCGTFETWTPVFIDLLDSRQQPILKVRYFELFTYIRKQE